jgi:2-amino-4-hydroxy-6-hydroxymethyldihydropteridine diphosphokinase
MMVHQVFIGIGSNLADPKSQVMTAYNAMDRLPQTRCLSLSPLYQSRAVGPVQPDYINAVAEISTHLEPLELLDALHGIESAQHRVRVEHWGPRTIDLDILLIDDLILTHTRLTVPHPFMTQRSFVLVPLYDLVPDLQLPDGNRLVDLVQLCDRDSLNRLSQDKGST